MKEPRCTRWAPASGQLPQPGSTTLSIISHHSPWLYRGGCSSAGYVIALNAYLALCCVFLWGLLRPECVCRPVYKGSCKCMYARGDCLYLFPLPSCIIVNCHCIFLLPFPVHIKSKWKGFERVCDSSSELASYTRENNSNRGENKFFLIKTQPNTHSVLSVMRVLQFSDSGPVYNNTYYSVRCEWQSLCNCAIRVVFLLFYIWPQAWHSTLFWV